MTRIYDGATGMGRYNADEGDQLPGLAPPAPILALRPTNCTIGQELDGEGVSVCTGEGTPQVGHVSNYFFVVGV